MTYTQIPEDTFKELQLNAGVITNTFDPESGTLDNDNIICATSGGITATATPTYNDLGSDIDNCPDNMKELKEINGWVCTLAFTALSVSSDTLKLALGAATKTAGASGKPDKLVPNADLAQTDFSDAIWWIGDKADGGFVAVKLLNALSTGGLSIKSNDSGKGQLAVTLTGHYSLSAQSTVPMEFYVLNATA